MKSASKKPVETVVAEPKKVKLTPVFNFDGGPSAESVVPEPGQSSFVAESVAASEPLTGMSQPLVESVPFEEERRSYFERRQFQGVWKGRERRGGEDRRSLRRQAKTVTPSPTDEKNLESDKASRRQLFPEWLRVAAWVAAIITIPGIVFYSRGWEASLAAFGIVATAFFTHHFFHLNNRRS